MRCAKQVDSILLTLILANTKMPGLEKECLLEASTNTGTF